jgi:hypothetical protein
MYGIFTNICPKNHPYTSTMEHMGRKILKNPGVFQPFLEISGCQSGQVVLTHCASANFNACCVIWSSLAANSSCASREGLEFWGLFMATKNNRFG